MKRFLAYFCCIFTLLGQSFSCLANDNIVGSTEAGNILYQDSAIILSWKINNSTTGNSRYEQKSFNAGFSSNNAEMCRMGIDAYYASK